MVTRRKLLKSLSVLPLVGGMLGTGVLSSQVLGKTIVEPATRDFFKELGLRTFINAAGTYTSMTGSLMHKEVTDAITYGATEYVNLDQLHDKVGDRIASLLNCEYATVSSGAFGAMTIGLAGVICGMDKKNVEQLPDLTGLKDEVILQEGHNIVYTHALRNVGVKIVTVKTRKELEKAINSKTAMMWFLNANTDSGEIKHEEFLEIAKKHSIPSFIDCAADVPPVENLFKFTEMGFDLVAFSGGKGIRGPQSAGLLLGNRKFIEAARLHTPPRGFNIGRGMKVNKEEVLGMLVALELYLERDHDREWKMWEDQIKLISDTASSVSGVKTEIHVPKYANRVPSLRIEWDQNIIKISPEELRKELREGHPSIETVGGKENVGITTWMLDPGQERIVALRIEEILQKNS